MKCRTVVMLIPSNRCNSVGRGGVLTDTVCVFNGGDSEKMTYCWPNNKVWICNGDMIFYSIKFNLIYRGKFNKRGLLPARFLKKILFRGHVWVIDIIPFYSSVKTPITWCDLWLISLNLINKTCLCLFSHLLKKKTKAWRGHLPLSQLAHLYKNCFRLNTGELYVQ